MYFQCASNDAGGMTHRARPVSIRMFVILPVETQDTSCEKLAGLFSAGVSAKKEIRCRSRGDLALGARDSRSRSGKKAPTNHTEACAISHDVPHLLNSKLTWVFGKYLSKCLSAYSQLDTAKLNKCTCQLMPYTGSISFQKWKEGGGFGSLYSKGTRVEWVRLSVRMGFRHNFVATPRLINMTGKYNGCVINLITLHSTINTVMETTRASYTY